MHDREVVVEVAGADVRRRLRDKLSALENAIPGRRAIHGQLETLGLRRVRRIFVRGVEREVLRSRLRAVDVPLVLADLVPPRPYRARTLSVIIETRHKGQVIHVSKAALVE